MNTQQAVSIVDRYVRSKQPLIVIISHEEDRVIQAITGTLCSSRTDLPTWEPRTPVEWTITGGIKGGDFTADETIDPPAALYALTNLPAESPPILAIMKDFHPYLNNPVVVRSLRDLANHFGNSKHTAIFISPEFTIPKDLEKTMVMVDWPLPDQSELAEILDEVEVSLPKSIPVTLNGNREKVIQSMQGLTAFEATSVLLNAVATTRQLGDDAIPHIVAEKKQIVRKAGVLEFIDADVTMSHVGGLPYLKEYAHVKKATFSREAKEYGVEPARGVLLLGLPGTGKSLTAKAIAGGTMPLLRMDVGALMGSLVGQSESNTRSAFKVAEAVAPCVLWLDEIEKALGGGGGEQDGGTSMRVLGTILTFMQETTAPIYFVATANDVRALRPELINRFDDVFFVDLPNQADREEILSVHLAKRGRTPADYDLSEVSKSCWGLVGREIERVVKSALEMAFLEKRALITGDMILAAQAVIPISVTMEDKIRELRSWAKNRALVAASPIENNPALQGSRRSVEV